MLTVALGAMIAWWSWRIGGAVAAIVATALFALDPNFLAHSALMKNDVVFALSLLLLAMALWRAGQRLTILNTATIALLCVFTLTVKFSGLAAVLLVPAMLGIRAMLPEPWPFLDRRACRRTRRLGIALIVVIVCMSVSYLGIWAVYGFRFRPTPQANVWLNMDELAEQGNMNHRAAEFDGHPPAGAFDQLEPTETVRAVLFANGHGLLPQAYLAGFLFTYDASLIRPCYLCGELSLVGWWWYFPFAMLVKTPIATIIAVCATIVFATNFLIAQTRRPKIDRRNTRLSKQVTALPAWAVKEKWTAICLAVPFTIFFIAAIFSHLNIGIRHVLGLYPFTFIAVGWFASTVWPNRSGRLTILVLLLGLAVESLSSFPNFIPFFNTIASADGGINLLGDSNLDWGQDLPLLKQWQNAHPNDTLYLSYFGYADPRFYGIRYIPLPGGYHYDPPPQFPDPYLRSVLAISATNLQGIAVDPGLLNFYTHWRNEKPIVVLGGSIYLFQYDPSAELHGR
jgi:hypothetical protein